MDSNSTAPEVAQPEFKHQIALPSKVALFIQMRFNGQVLSSGSGFIHKCASGKFYLVTNRHNVTGRRQNTNECLSKNLAVPNEISVFVHTTEEPGEWTEAVLPLYDGESPRWKEHPTLGARADFVAVPIVAEFPQSYSWWFHDDAGEYEQAVAPAETVSVVGFPFGKSYAGYYPIWATGFVASEPTIDYDDLPIFLIDCRSRQGQSGSPVIKHSNGGTILLRNGKGVMGAGITTTWLGIYSGRISPESDIGIVWKKQAVLELLHSI